MTAAFVIVLLCAWVGAIIALMIKAMDWSGDDNRKAWAYAIAAVLVFAIIIGFAIEAEESGPLCARGHEEYQQRTSYHMIGKVMMPSTSTHRVWVCDSYEATR